MEKHLLIETLVNIMCYSMRGHMNSFKISPVAGTDKAGVIQYAKKLAIMIRNKTHCPILIFYIMCTGVFYQPANSTWLNRETFESANINSMARHLLSPIFSGIN